MLMGLCKNNNLCTNNYKRMQGFNRSTAWHAYCMCVWQRLENVNIIGHEKGTLVHSSVQQELPGAFNLLQETARNNLLPDTASMFVSDEEMRGSKETVCRLVHLRGSKWWLSSLIQHMQQTMFPSSILHARKGTASQGLWRIHDKGRFWHRQVRH